MSDYTVRVWGKDFNLIDTITHGWRMDEPGIVVVPAESKFGQAVLRPGVFETTFLTVDHPKQERWIGRMDTLDVQALFGVGRQIRANFRATGHEMKLLDQIGEWWLDRVGPNRHRNEEDE